MGNFIFELQSYCCLFPIPYPERECVFAGEGVGKLQEMEPSDYADEQYGYFQQLA
ncbi:hypothetical protein [Nostoc sp. CHAB 5715]|uniref:hypothetical protein n=1 Tax=Nostoc sp. CHAB 5715 TaxID=2780400 RepID=UPI001E2F0426|nr:hypothetical protein [Nostoc sp. CHAB 5715]MCC5623526.1 hypothetical protein [Nostoc sp. CHAB 5715]